MPLPPAFTNPCVRPTRRRRRAPAPMAPVCCTAPPEKDYPEPFDRDYYPALKAAHAHLPNIRIYAKEDYQIDPTLLPWLREERSLPVDLAAARRAARAAPVLPTDLPAVPRPWPAHLLHPPRHIHHFRRRLRVADPISGRLWHHPLSHLDALDDDGDDDGDDDHDDDNHGGHGGDVLDHPDDHPDGHPDDHIHLRHVPPHHHRHADLSRAHPPPRRVARVFASHADELAALRADVDAIQAENLDAPSPFSSWDHRVPPPTAEHFSNWSAEARARGGNAVAHPSYFLPPAARPDGVHVPGDRAPAGSVPPQTHALLAAHAARWHGRLLVLRLAEGQPRRVADVPVRSDLTAAPDGLEWTSVVEAPAADAVSEVMFPALPHDAEMVCGCAVAADGSYVRARARAGRPAAAGGVTVGDRFLKSVVGGADCVPQIEVCLVDGDERQRVLLCTADAAGNEFEYIVVISERRVATGEGEATAREVGHVSVDALLGDWEGVGMLLQPEFPTIPCKKVSTSSRIALQDGITEDKVSWMENEVADEPDMVSKRRVRTKGKKKVSRRVAAARAHDTRRLGECSMLWREDVDGRAETHAWKLVGREGDEFQGIMSPRVGRFVVDYCGVVLPGGLLITFPSTRAFPQLWNTVILTQVRRPVRKRVTAGRNEVGSLVAGLFVTEREGREELADEVATYV